MSYLAFCTRLLVAGAAQRTFTQFKVSNAYAEEADTGDLAFREHADDNRASFRRTVGSTLPADPSALPVSVMMLDTERW